jgi:hypothetical protein
VTKVSIARPTLLLSHSASQVPWNPIILSHLECVATSFDEHTLTLFGFEHRGVTVSVPSALRERSCHCRTRGMEASEIDWLAASPVCFTETSCIHLSYLAVMSVRHGYIMC